MSKIKIQPTPVPVDGLSDRPKPIKQTESVTPGQDVGAGGDKTKIKSGKSALSDFVKRNLATDDEADKFEKYVREEVRENEIEEGLAEIYQDDNGKMIDVDKVEKIEIKRSGGPFLRLLIVALFLTGLVNVGWASYYLFFLKPAGDNSLVNLSIAAEREIPAGKEFYYTIQYRNLDRIELKNLAINAIYPENFIFLSSDPAAATGSSTWTIASLASKRGGEIRIKGKLIAPEGSAPIILANMAYTPANFTSEFKKEASFESLITSTGIDFTFDSVSSLMIGEENEILIRYKGRTENYLPGFRLNIEPIDNVIFLKPAAASSSASSTDPWTVSAIDGTERELKVRFKVKDKLADALEIPLKFEYTDDGLSYHLFYEKKITFEVMKRNLNLTLIINGERTDQGVNFGQTLNYSIVYANKGEQDMRDLVIMAALESDFLDWSSLDDKNKGVIRGSSISWSKDEIPALASLAPDAEGTIDFSIKVAPLGEIDPSKSYQIKSYGQFSVNQGTSTLAAKPDSGPADNRSNTIINKINSDLTLNEQVRYFNDDNIAVGSGPLPPKVGQTTSYKIYWTLTNNLNELTGLKIETAVPKGVNFDNKSRVSVGTLAYDAASGKIVWDVGRLPITVYKIDAEFNLSITPVADDANTLLVLLPGTVVSATDEVTKTVINKTYPAKTTKLSDDPIVTDDGRVVP